MENLFSTVFNDIKRKEEIRNVIRDELTKFRKEIRMDINESYNNPENVKDNSQEEIMVKKINELKIYINNLEKSCNSLNSMLRKFK